MFKIKGFCFLKMGEVGARVLGGFLRDWGVEGGISLWRVRFCKNALFGGLRLVR